MSCKGLRYRADISTRTTARGIQMKEPDNAIVAEGVKIVVDV